jgi:signal recognition particle receptor subunit beta
MVLFNAATRELTAKIVYYGPGLCGKTTNLLTVYDSLPQDGRGKMLSLATQTDRTLFFDFLPIELGTIRGMKTRIQLYTVPGQVFYDATRKLVLRGADAVVFVADSQAQALDGNKESFQNLIENLREQGTELEKLPHVIQYNKRDIANALPVATLDRELNRFGAPTFEACATRGTGVRETLKGVALLVLRHLSEKYGGGEEPASAELFAAPAQAARATLVVPPDLPEPDRAIRATGSGPLEVEDLGAGELLDELEELPITQSGGLAADPALGRGSSVVEVPVVLDRSLFSGDSPVEIRLKLYLK